MGNDFTGESTTSQIRRGHSHSIATAMGKEAGVKEGGEGGKDLHIQNDHTIPTGAISAFQHSFDSAYRKERAFTMEFFFFFFTSLISIFTAFF